jgi:hypothetical protein
MGALTEDSLLVEAEVEAIIQEENNDNDLEPMGKVTKGWKVAKPPDIKLPQDLSISAVREWALGPYAIKLAYSYVSHSKFTLKWHFHPRHAGVLRVSGIPSRYVLTFVPILTCWCRFTSQAKHKVYFRFGTETGETVSYCTCKSGARIVGGCAHAVSILYHLSQKDKAQVGDNKKRKRTARIAPGTVLSASKATTVSVPNIKLSRSVIYEVDCIIQDDEHDEDLTIRIKRKRMHYSVVVQDDDPQHSNHVEIKSDDAMDIDED